MDRRQPDIEFWSTALHSSPISERSASKSRRSRQKSHISQLETFGIAIALTYPALRVLRAHFSSASGKSVHPSMVHPAGRAFQSSPAHLAACVCFGFQEGQ